MWHEDTPERAAERKPYEDAFAADRERYRAELAEWQAEIERRQPQPETDAQAFMRTGSAPPDPRRYPKPFDLWRVASKAKFAAENPGLDGHELKWMMTAAWPQVSAEEKAPLEAESKRLKTEFETNFALWEAARRPVGGDAAVAVAADAVSSAQGVDVTRRRRGVGRRIHGAAAGAQPEEDAPTPAPLRVCGQVLN